MTAAAAAGGDAVPVRRDWPEPAPQNEAGALVTEVVLTTFRLNARVLDAAQHLAAAGGLTAAWWQVLGGVLDQPRTVAEVSRRMGVSRQGVLRIADLLVERGLAEYRTNPAHRRAQLLACTEAGYWAIRQISLVTHPWSDQIGEQVGAAELRSALATMQRLVEVLEAEPCEGRPPQPRGVPVAGAPETGQENSAL
jgi:DNA-binding MarR family transcriptional regulator